MSERNFTLIDLLDGKFVRSFFSGVREIVLNCYLLKRISLLAAISFSKFRCAVIKFDRYFYAYRFTNDFSTNEDLNSCYFLENGKLVSFL